MLTKMGPTRQAPFPFFPIRVPRSSGHHRRPPLSPPQAPHLCLASPRAGSAASVTAGTPDGSERWGYVEVRPSNN